MSLRNAKHLWIPVLRLVMTKNELYELFEVAVWIIVFHQNFENTTFILIFGYYSVEQNLLILFSCVPINPVLKIFVISLLLLIFPLKIIALSLKIFEYLGVVSHSLENTIHLILWRRLVYKIRVCLLSWWGQFFQEI